MLTYSFYESDTRVQQYTTALLERGVDVDVVALRRDGAPKHEILDGATVYRIQSRAVNEQSRVASLFRLVRFLVHSAYFIARKHLSERYDLIHVHSMPDFLVFAALVPKALGAHVILDIHDILPEFYASKFHSGQNSLLFKVLLRVERLSAAVADYIIVANDLWCERVKARSATRGNCIAIRNYPDPQRFFSRPKSGTNGKFLIVYPGTLNWHQGVDLVVRAFAKIKDTIPEAELHIYGEGPARPNLIKLADQLALDGKVIFKDFVPTGEIAGVMAAADLAVVPKRASSPFGNEAASTKIFEFMALGVPLVVSKTKIDTYYLDDSMVKFFESDNEDDLANAIVTVARNPQLRARLASNASRYATDHTWEKKKLEYLQLVDSLAGARKRQQAANRPA
jgi:glycosyltransferase involved in cell wall biosynthesis